jgi:uncharacterized protein YbjT (DUF2867 family)
VSKVLLVHSSRFDCFELRDRKIFDHSFMQERPMALANLPPLVTVFGGSGFVGRHIVRTLAKRGYRIRVAVRRPDLAGFLQPLGNVGQISFAQANLRYRDSVRAAVDGADFVVNCVGVLNDGSRNGFDAVHDLGAKLIAEAAKSVGAKLTHISAIGADANSPSAYARSKARGEAAVRGILADSIILRPSIVFGPEDDFFNKLGNMAKRLPFLPLIGGGETKFQPVYVDDVAEAVARSVEGQLIAGKTYELGGPEVLSCRECFEKVLAVTYRERRLVNLPFAVASLIGTVSSLIPLIPPALTSDQVQLLKSDNVVSNEAVNSGSTLESMGIKPVAVDAVLSTYMVSYRENGQFARAGRAA